MNVICASTTAASSSGASQYSMIIMLLLIFVIFWLFMIRPENKRKKKLEEMRNALGVGDEIVTIGGITGKVVQATEDTITFETGEDRVRIQVKKWAISTNAREEAAEAAAKARKRGGKPTDSDK
jgi:preprotein translocase subunit YajC